MRLTRFFPFSAFARRRHPRVIVVAVVASLAVLSLPATASAATLTWTGLTNTDWGTASNWTPMAVPGAADSAVINNTSLNNPVVGSTNCASCAVNSVTLSGNKQLVIADGTLNVGSGVCQAPESTIHGICAPSGTNVLMCGTQAACPAAGGTLTFGTLTIDNATGLTLSGGHLAGTLVANNPATVVNGTGGTAASYDVTGGTFTLGSNVTLDQTHDVTMANAENLSIGNQTYILDGANINVPGATTSSISVGGGSGGTFRHAGSTGGVVQAPVNMDISGQALLEDAGTTNGNGLDLSSPFDQTSNLAGLLRTTNPAAAITLDAGATTGDIYKLGADVTTDNTPGGLIKVTGTDALNLNSHTLFIKGTFIWDASVAGGANVSGSGTFGSGGGPQSVLSVLGGGPAGGSFQTGKNVMIASGTTMDLTGGDLQLPDNFGLHVLGELDLTSHNLTSQSSPPSNTTLLVSPGGRLVHIGANIASIGPVVNSNGTIEDDSGPGGQLILQQGPTVTNLLAGTLQTDNMNSVIELGSAVHQLQGTLTTDTSRGGAVQTGGSADVQLNGNTLTLIGSFSHSGGTISTNSAATIAGPGTLFFLGGANLALGGPLTITAPVHQSGATDVGGFGGELDIGGTWLSRDNITDTGDTNAVIKVLSGGVLRHDMGSAGAEVLHPLTIDGLVDDASPSGSAGSPNWEVDSTNGGTNPGGTTTVDPGGTLSVSAAAPACLKVANLSNYNSGTSTLSGGNYAAAGQLQIPGAVTTLDANLSLSGSGALTTDCSGTSALSGLTTLPSGRTLTLTGQNLTTGNPLTVNGTLAGDGTINGSVINNGTVSPGHSPGTLTVNGNYTQGSSGALNIKVQGATSGTYDVLDVLGNVNLGGTLNLLPSAAYAAAAVPGDTQAFLPYSGTRSGTFATTTVSPVLAGGKPFTAVYDDADKRVVSSVGQPPPAPVTPVTATTPPAPIVPTPPPSSPPPPQIVVEKAKAKKDGVIALTLFAPEPGTFDALATIHVIHGRVIASKLVTYGTATANTSQSGPVKLAIQPTAAGQRLLRNHKSIPVAVHLSFRSSASLGSTAASKDLRIKVKGKKKH